MNEQRKEGELQALSDRSCSRCPVTLPPSLPRRAFEHVKNAVPLDRPEAGSFMRPCRHPDLCKHVCSMLRCRYMHASSTQISTQMLKYELVACCCQCTVRILYVLYYTSCVSRQVGAKRLRMSVSSRLGRAELRRLLLHPMSLHLPGLGAYEKIKGRVCLFSAVGTTRPLS